MYFWKIDQLKKDLLKKPLSESESFKYFFANAVLISLAMIPFLENNIWDLYSAVIQALIAAIGTYYVYKCNKGASGDHFLQKYLSIGWVLIIRWIVFMLPTTLVYYIAVEIFSSISDTTTLSDLIFFNTLSILYYWRLGKHIKELAQ